jgi:RNA recognition motif-containing protein
MEQQQFRLHVGGLGPSVAPQDLERRFASFGTVVKVDGVGKLDANGTLRFQSTHTILLLSYEIHLDNVSGSPLRYAFVDILSTDSEMKRCMVCLIPMNV